MTTFRSLPLSLAVLFVTIVSPHPHRVNVVRSIFTGDQADFGYVEMLFKL